MSAELVVDTNTHINGIASRKRNYRRFACTVRSCHRGQPSVYSHNP